MRLELYRPCVGIMLINERGLIFVGQRADDANGYWQMPQGGIEDGESVDVAAFRELFEETGVTSARSVRILDEWLYYDIPVAHCIAPWRGKYIGQRQKWVLMRFLGDDSEINLMTAEQEFIAWRWAKCSFVLESIVPFKRAIYERVCREFFPLGA